MTTTTESPAPAQTPTPGARPADSAFAGTGTMIRFILRRDRIKLPAWVLGISALVMYYAALLPTVFETAEELQGMSQVMGGPVGALIAGPGYGADDPTIERLIVGVYGLFLFVLAALMSILLVSRHTRVDEQAGRAELVRATVVGRHAQLAASLVVAAGASVLLALLVGGAMAANGYAAGDGLLFGASIGAVALVFAGVAAVTVQVTEYSRAASGIAGATLGAAWVIRAVGDMLEQHGSLLSWFSPLAWSQQTRAYVDGRWWPLALSVGFAAAVAAVGFVLSSRRDVGGALVAPRRGSRDAAGWLSSPFAFAFRLHRSGLLGWGLALGLAGLLFGWMTDTMIDAYAEMGEDMIAVLGGDAENLLQGYLSVMALFMALLVGVFVILGVQSVRSEETKGRAEPVLATAIGRGNWLGSHLAVLALGAIALLFAAGFATGAGAAIATGEAAYLWDVTAAHLVHVPAVLVLLGVAAWLFGMFPRAVGATWALLGYGFFIGFFGPLMDAPRAATYWSPFEHVARLPLDTLTWTPVAVLTAIAVVAVGLGLWCFRLRDLDSK